MPRQIARFGEATGIFSALAWIGASITLAVAGYPDDEAIFSAHPVLIYVALAFGCFPAVWLIGAGIYLINRRRPKPSGPN